MMGERVGSEEGKKKKKKGREREYVLEYEDLFERFEDGFDNHSDHTLRTGHTILGDGRAQEARRMLV